MNVLPSPGVLVRPISPPSSRTSSRLIDSPRPVPPYWRAVVPSAWANASKMRAASPRAMPMPVSLMLNAVTASARASASFAGLQPLVGAAHAHAHLALLGELERVREQVLQHLAQAPGVGGDRRRQVRRELDGEARRPSARRRAEIALERRP